ncbi:MAG: amino acid permease [Saprospiraceae bacterium]|nr:amino acid permease [Saprospiraceae bacterium]MCF8251799.1 amino acid permease [Saprospiraceae bacterium]MCF8281453.1 amino acid permease [Bacteroidales bacterium]MCF8313513.1 amino acid permease [Saprospiraceae bacterium]MCF8442264.1 amino acid permease [Saprospiraceae bacterium]
MQALQDVKKFGTAPVFFTAISTILGAVMFLRFGFSVGNVGLLGTLAIIIIGHLVTIPTAMAIAEIATNQKVEGGGEYYIISRSFGLVIGSTIGIALYLSQAISVAFYILAFTEAFSSFFGWLAQNFSLPSWLVWLFAQKQTIGIPALLGLTYIMLTKGADLGVKALYIVVATLGISLLAFFVGTTEYSQTHGLDLMSTVADIPQAVNKIVTNSDLTTQQFQDSTTYLNPSPATSPVQQQDEPPSPLIPLGFFTVFAIIFPAFTGMTAGVGLSGDLRDPGKSLPMGTMAATLFGMIIYVFIAYKLAASASPADLADTSKLVMADIAWQGWWLIPLGLAAATISSALGSIMVAPRTLQAIARDQIFPTPGVNNWLSKGKGAADEPFNATVLTVILAGAFILAGALDMVAQVISMFFMVTYGSLCLISFLNHFAADPSYRPKFKSRWYISLFGAIACFGLMFFMNGGYAVVAIISMVGLYFVIASFNKDKKSIALIFQGVIFQFSRQLQVFLQKADKEQTKSWRPSAVAFSERSFDRLGAFHLLRWISQKYGFGTYIHRINGYLSRQSGIESKQCKDRLIKMAETTDSNIYVDTMVTPSFTSGIAQIMQLPGIAGTENNLLIFEFAKKNPEEVAEIVDNFKLIQALDFDVLVLGGSERGFGLKKQIHIWITSADYDNANLMILLAYIIMGHKDWREAEIKIFAIYPEGSIEEERNRFLMLISAGQLPISPNNIEFITRKPDISNRTVISQKSKDADLTIVGFREEALTHHGKDVFGNLDEIGNVLFVSAGKQKEIK